MKLKFTLLLLFPFLLATAQTIERVDPPNWWAGMKHNQIQLLIYGDQVGSLKPTIDYPGVHLINTHVVENPNYLFLNISIHEEMKPGEMVIQFQGKEKTSLRHTFPIYERAESRKSLTGFDATDAIYLITPDRFVNGDPSNDNIASYRENANRSFKGGRHGGDIKGLRNSIDYIKDLGFTAVWLNPLLENDMEEYSYHGYSTTDYYKVDAHYGTNEEYKQFAEECRAKGMKLIMDMIVNHCGSFHWWMEDLPTKDWINQWDEMTFTNHRKTTLQDPYVSDIDKKIFTDGWFVQTMPDLNQRNPLMAKYLIQNSLWWVEYLGLAGIRMDTYPYPDMHFMTDWTEAMMKEYPNLNIVGEEWFESPTIVSYWQKGKNNANGYTSELKSVMDFPLQMNLSKALMVKENWGDGWIDVYELLAQDFLYADPLNLVIFPDNHDMSRIFTQMEEDYDKFKQAITFFLTMRGIPQLYYGTEILMKNPGTGDHGIIRSDFPGGWSGDAVNGFTGEGLTQQAKEAKNFIRSLLKWRQTASAVHFGNLKHFIPKDGVYVYFRYDENQKVMVVLNKNEDTTTLALERFSEVLDGAQLATDILTKKTTTLGKSMEVAGKSATVLELK